eukprot:c8783_g1_i1.p1 GENE.c8783_g1_i1~~c8783_g1_i1.p1  ORF type:complete len:532 (+),score=126.89 c8783_g1_i1:32-1627(+)
MGLVLCFVILTHSLPLSETSVSSICDDLSVNAVESTSPQSNCGAASEMTTFQNTRIHSCGSDATSSFVKISNAKLVWENGEFRVGDPCGTGAGAAHLGLNLAQSLESSTECAQTIEEPTVFVSNPREEYLHNMYHTMEEIVAVQQTLHVLKVPVKSSRMIFGWSGSPDRDARLVEMTSQLQGLPGEESVVRNELQQASRVRPQILELWEKLFESQTKVTPIGRINLQSGRPICFKQLIFPSRACSGSIVPLCWDDRYDCQISDTSHSAALLFSEQVVRAYGYDTEQLVSKSAEQPLKILMITRSSSERGKRTLSNLEEAKNTLANSVVSYKQLEAEVNLQVFHELPESLFPDFSAMKQSFETFLNSSLFNLPTIWSPAMTVAPVMGTPFKMEPNQNSLMAPDPSSMAATTTTTSTTANTAMLTTPQRRATVDFIDFADLTMAQQIEHVRAADMLIGQHGAGLMHLLFMKKGAAVIEVSPHPGPVAGRSVANIFRNLAFWTGHPYQVMHADGQVNVSQLLEEVQKMVRAHFV